MSWLVGMVLKKGERGGGGVTQCNERTRITDIRPLDLLKDYYDSIKVDTPIARTREVTNKCTRYLLVYKKGFSTS